MKLFVAEESKGPRLILGCTSLARARALYNTLALAGNIPLEHYGDPAYQPDPTNVTQHVRIREANAQESDAFWTRENEIVRSGGAAWNEQYD